jgi:iron complex outermembrane receptor protein
MLFIFAAVVMHAQQTGAKLAGTVVDVQGNAIGKATVTAKNESTGAVKTTRADAAGAYSIDGLAAGKYTVEATAGGFDTLTRTGIALAAGQSLQIPLKLPVNSVAEMITVNAGIDSIAAETAPSGGFLEERSAQSLVSNTYIENFTSPIADFGEIVQIVPGTFTTSANGVGLGQSKTYFRGIPFYDTNTPTHHSWAFFPSEWIGGVDFDRSPGTASTIGPTPFGGSIHLLSKPLSSEQDVRGTASYGTWNTKLYDGAYNSGSFGLFGSPKKSNLYVDVHHMTSDGYQSFNYNLRNAGSLLYQYQFSPKTVLTGFAGIVQLNSNGPNITSSRCMLYGVPATGAYSCASPTVSVNGTATPVTANGLLPFTGAGLKFLLTDNSDPVSWFDQQYNKYQVPTDFEYVSLKTEFGKSWYLEVKPYTYNYDNGELYSNVTPMTEVTAAAAAANPSLVPGAIVVGGKAYYDGLAIAPCDVQVVKKGIAALPCGIDKYNSYRKYGEMWYEWAQTNRHQYPSDPVNNWADQALPKFNESFWTNSYQPYAEFEFHVTPKFNLTAGTKYALYTIDVVHQADDGATVGPLTCASNTAPCSATAENKGTFKAWLPSLDATYRVLPNWSVYGQAATGSIVPPSSVYDYNQTAASASAAVPTISAAPKQQRSTTYQAGIVYKGQRFTIDADAYRIRFQNSYSSTVDNIPGDVDLGDTIYYLQPSSVSKGLEFETTAVLAHGLNLYVNATAANAFYAGSLNAGTQAAPYLEKAPSGLWVASTPTDTEQEGLTYQNHGFDLGIFNHRIGEERVDNGQYHNQAIVPTFSSVNTYVNFTVRNRSIFDGTKIRLDATNLLDSHNIQSLSLAGAAPTVTIPGTTLTDQFNTNGPTPINGQDTPAPMAGRSFAVTVTFGLAPRER